MAIIKSRHRRTYVWFFEYFSKWMIRRHFSRVRFHGEFIDQGLPVLLIGNHFSWWDGFIANLMNKQVFHRKFHVMMREDQLQKRMFLNKAGAFSINKGRRSILESIDYASGLLVDKNNLLVLYPQGEFQSLAQFPVKFEPGIQRILSDLKGDIHLVFYVALVDYFEKRKPMLDIYFRQHESELVNKADDLESLYNQYLAGCIKQQKPVI